MNIRLIMILSSLISVTIDTYALWDKIFNWFEDPTQYVAIVNIYTKGNVFYSEYNDHVQRCFPTIKLEQDTPIASVILFSAKTKRKVETFKLENRYYLLKDYIKGQYYLPITMMKDLKEGDGIQIDKVSAFCAQKALTPQWSFEEVMILHFAKSNKLC